MKETFLEAIDHLLSIIDKYKLTIYQALFPPQGGLSDIYYWDNDFEKRNQINNILSSSNKIISDYLLNQ